MKRTINILLAIAIVLSLAGCSNFERLLDVVTPSTVSTGLKYFRYAKLNGDGKTYGEIKTLAGAMERKVSLKLDEAVHYTDNGLIEQVSEFKSGTLTVRIDEDDDKIFAELLGNTVDKETNLVTSNTKDTPIYVGFGHIVSKVVGNKKSYKVEFFPKLKFKPFIVDAKIKDGASLSDGLELTTPSVEATIFEDSDGNWEKHSTFDTDEEAKTALDALFEQQSGGQP